MRKRIKALSGKSIRGEFIMCLYPRLIRNRKYMPNKKNGGNPEFAKDWRTEYVPIGCGQCMECRKQKSREWQTRLTEHIKTNTNGIFVTLTFSEESMQAIKEKCDAKCENDIAKEAVKLFRERWRKKYKKSIPHWLITELGHNGTERLHLHGLLFTNHKEDIEKIWDYGWVYLGEYVNNRTINYIMKYVTKVDNDHKDFNGVILCSPGIGKDYINTQNFKRTKFNGDKTHDEYVLPNGRKMNAPIYYRNKAYSEEEREQLWINRLNQNTRYVDGMKIEHTNTIEGMERYQKALIGAREKNKRLGYGKIKWSKKKYFSQLEKLSFVNN